MNLYTLDIINSITEHLNIIDILKLKKMSKYYYQNIKILYFGVNYIDNKYITNEILDKFPDVRKIYLHDIDNLSNINQLKYLNTLKIDGLCSINYNAIKKLKKIREIDISYNIYIKRIPKARIKILKINGNSLLDNRALKHLDLEELDCSFNNKISKISDFPNLKKLIIRYDSKITETEINIHPNIEYLDISYNYNIRNITNKNIKFIIFDNDHPIKNNLII